MLLGTEEEWYAYSYEQRLKGLHDPRDRGRRGCMPLRTEVERAVWGLWVLVRALVI
jgi:hypothetical protein